MKSLFGSRVEYYTVDTKAKFTGKPRKKLEGTATFLQFGSDNEEGGTYSTAIIRLDNGFLKNIYVEFIRFIEND